jgi:UDP-2-acetamido-3-amino-2,3-dideoxy-glucuronate N-acetyltransferase
MKTINANPTIAVIGTGYWGKNLVRNFHNLGALHTVCDVNPDTLDNFMTNYPDVNGVSSYSEILTNKDIKGVVISTPAEMHSDMAKEAILAGKDVYVEKPLCLSEKEGVELIDLARQHDRILMVGHLLWYHPVVLKLKELVDAGELGRIQYIYSNRLNLGKLRREENVLWSFAPHDISVILGLLGEEPETVQAQGGNYLHQKIADTTVTLLNFASGVKAHIFVSWLHPFKEQKLVVVGERKMAVFNDTASWDEKLMLYPHAIKWSGNIPVADKAEAIPVAVDEEEPLRNECAHFLDCIAKRTPPRTDGHEGLQVLKVLNSCQKALETGRLVTITEQFPAATGDYFVHDSSVIDDNVTIGAGTKIWHFSHVLSNTDIGRDCNIGQNVVIGPNTTVGSNCKIQNNVSVYDGVTLEDDVFCGPSMVFTNVMNPRSAVSRKDKFLPTLVKKGATLGANCTVVCGNTIGTYAFIGAGAVVISSVPDFALMVGNPARQIGWMSMHGERLDLPLEGDGEAVCPQTGDVYQLKDGEVTLAQAIV